MAVAFQAVGSIAFGGGGVVDAVAPACVTGDILIATILVKDNGTITVPSGWTKFVEINNTASQRTTLAWKAAVGADSGATFSFTSASNPTPRALIAAYRGCASNAPIDATAPSTSANAVSDTVSYATFDPTETTAFVVAIGVYNLNATTAGAIAGTDPTLANNWDLEDANGTTASFFGYSGSSTGALTGARSHSTTSTTDAINTGILFGFVAGAAPGAPTALTVTAAQRLRNYVSWTAPASDGGSAIQGYKIERESPTGGGFATLIASTGSQATSFVDAGLSGSTQYNYRVSAINPIGTSAASIAAAATTLAAQSKFRPFSRIYLLFQPFSRK